MVLYCIDKRCLWRWPFRDTLRYVSASYQFMYTMKSRYFKGRTVPAFVQGWPYRLRTQGEFGDNLGEYNASQYFNFLKKRGEFGDK